MKREGIIRHENFRNFQEENIFGFLEAMMREIGRGNFFGNSCCTGPDLREKRRGALNRLFAS
jgi:hypothetical protein